MFSFLPPHFAFILLDLATHFSFNVLNILSYFCMKTLYILKMLFHSANDTFSRCRNDAIMRGEHYIPVNLCIRCLYISIDFCQFVSIFRIGCCDKISARCYCLPSRRNNAADLNWLDLLKCRIYKTSI